MERYLDTLLILVLALNFFMLGVSRVRAVIHAVAYQGVLLGVMPLLVTLLAGQDVTIRVILLMAGVIALKGFVIPRLLFHAMREANIQREVSPLVDYIPSLLLGAVGTGLALVFASRLPLAEGHAELLLVPASLATVATGFLVLTTRRLAIVQVLGYLVLENGIFMFGMLLVEAMPFLVEVGVLLDLFTGVFVMGIIIHQINREFASADTEQLSELKE
jgi:hydrogenase-4 component E